MSDKMNPKSSADDRSKEEKQTSLLTDYEDVSEVSSSRKLDFSIAVETLNDTYPHIEQILMVYFPQKAEPILFTETDTILVGRSSGISVDLDTTPFHGRELGVSRQHAEIVYDNSTYFVRDLKSTNGTWLNTERLEPMKRYAVKAGDQLRVGQCLMILFVR